MTSREKIFLGITAAAAVGALVYYASGAARTASAAPKAKRADFTALITNVQVSLSRGQLTDREERVLAAAAMRWQRDPLLERPLVTQKRETEEEIEIAAAPLPQYIGFIDIGPQPIAIVDGRDYRAGEMIEGGEFQLSQIHPDHIKLLRRGATEPVDVPLEQEQTTGGS